MPDCNAPKLTLTLPRMTYTTAAVIRVRFLLEGFAVKCLRVLFVALVLAACNQESKQPDSGQHAEVVADDAASRRNHSQLKSRPKGWDSWSATVYAAAFSPDGECVLTGYAYSGSPLKR